MKAQDQTHGIQLTNEFFDDIVVPPALMKGSGTEMRWETQPDGTGHWTWVYRAQGAGEEGADAMESEEEALLPIFNDDEVRIRVDTVQFNEPPPVAQPTAAAAPALLLGRQGAGPGAAAPNAGALAPSALRTGLAPAPAASDASGGGAGGAGAMTLENYGEMLLTAAANKACNEGDLLVAGGQEGDGTSLPVIRRVPPSASTGASGASSSGAADALKDLDQLAVDPGAQSTIFAPSRSLGSSLPLYTAASPINRPGWLKAPFRPVLRGHRAPALGGAQPASAAAPGADDHSHSVGSVMGAAMAVVGNIVEDGLGCTGWWPGEDDEPEEAADGQQANDAHVAKAVDGAAS